MSDPYENVPAFVVCPVLRCYRVTMNSPRVVCGELARWRELGRHWFDDSFFCDQHRNATDVPVVDDVAIRRVRITADVFLAGTNIRAPQAQAEAVARLERAVAAAGGILDVQGVLSTVGRIRPAAALGGEIGPIPSRG
jgi:hypothetical protein